MENVKVFVGNGNQKAIKFTHCRNLISIGDTAELIAEVMNTEIKIITDQSRLRPEKSEVERLWADNTRAKQLFGWQPSYGGREGFKRGLAETAKWFAQETNLRCYKSDFYNV